MQEIDGKEYLTVKEFAAAANVSQQAIYKKLKLFNSFKPYSTKLNNQTFIEKSALGEFFGLNFSTTGCSTFNNQIQPNSTSDDNVKELIAMLRNELETKNKQIDSLTEQLSKTTEALRIAQENVKAAQLLQGNTEQKLKLLEQQNADEPPQNEKTAAKRGFFAFRKK